jgi:hypothetical protein
LCCYNVSINAHDNIEKHNVVKTIPHFIRNQLCLGNDFRLYSPGRDCLLKGITQFAVIVKNQKTGILASFNTGISLLSGVVALKLNLS